MLSLTKTKKEIEYELPPIDRAMRLAGFAFAQAASSLVQLGAGQHDAET